MPLIPSDIRVPLVYVAFDPSKAEQGPSILRYKALIMGQKMATGTKDELEVFRAYTASEVEAAAGSGSQAHRMAEKWFLNNKFTETYCVLIDDSGTGVAATGTIVITGTASEDGYLYLLINGVSIQVTVTDGDTATEIGDAIVTAITAKTILPVTAVNVTGTVTLTAKNDGTPANSIDTRINHYDGEVTPAGVTVAVTAVGGVIPGSNDIDIAEIIAILGDEWYNVIVCPWSDTTNRGLLETELADRFGSIRMIDAMAMISLRGTVGALTTYGNNGNSPHINCMHSQGIPEAPEEVASVNAALQALYAQQDPARPFQSLEMVGITAPKTGDRFIWSENNGLLFDGISTFEVNASGKVVIQHNITMYQLDAQSNPDTAYLNTTTLFTLMYIRYDFRTFFATNYPRAKLMSDSDKIPSGQQIMTPKRGEAEAVNLFKGWSETLGITEGLEQFKRDLIVVRDSDDSQTVTNDPDRLNFYISPDLVNQLRVLTGVVQFLLQNSST